MTNQILYANAFAITEIIDQDKTEDNYLICNRTLTSGIRVLYHATFNNLYHFQLCWIIFNHVGFWTHSY